MKKNIITVGVGMLMLLLSPTVKAQDPGFTQNFYSNPLYVNPAIMGMNTNFKTILNYRSQWKSVGGGYTNYSFTSLFPLYMNGGDQKLDLGLNIMNNQQGAYNALNASLSVGYNLQLNESGFISFSLQGSFNQNSLDASGLTFDDQYVLGSYSASNPTSQTITNQSVNYANMACGLMWYHNPEDAKLNSYVGISSYNLLEPNQTFNTTTDPLYRRYSFQAGVKIKGEKKIDVTPNVIGNIQSGSESLIAGVIIDYHVSDNANVMFGSWYRKGDAFPVMLGLDISGIALRYSYDITNSYLSGAITGLATHEITLSYDLNMAEKKGGRNVPSFY